MSLATGLTVPWNWTRVPEYLVVLRCLCRDSGFGLWDGLPLLLPVQRCNTVFLASWACACRTSCGLAHLIPETSEISCVGVPTDHWSVPFFWHPNFRLTVLSPRSQRCALHTLDETTVPDFLIVLRWNRPCCVHTLCCSDNVLIALCGSSEQGLE